MKKQVKVAVISERKECFPDQHDFFQISDPGHLTGHTLGALGHVPPKPPRIACRKCGKVITIS